MTGKTGQGEHSKLGKAALPAVVTLLAGLGAGLFAMRPEGVPVEPRSDDFRAPSSLAETPRSAAPVALVAPDFGPESVVPLSASAPATAPVAAQPIAAVALPGQLETEFAPAPGLLAAPAPIAAPAPLAARPDVQLAEVEQPPVAQPPAMAVPAQPALAVVAVPVEQPVMIASSEAPETMPVSPPAASRQDNPSIPASIAVAQTAVVEAPIAAPPAAPAPQLAIADWNYSLPDQDASSDRSAFAGAASNAPITLVPSRAAKAAPAASRSARASNLATPAVKAPAAAGNRKIAGAGFASALHGKDKYRLVGSEIEFQLPVVANGTPVGNLTLHVAPNQQVSLRLGELLSLFHDQIDPQELTTLVASPSIDSFVTFEKLREVGIDIRYDAARDRIALSVEQP